MNHRLLFPLLRAAAISGLIGAGAARAQVSLADIRANFATTGLPLTDTFGTGSWVYYASTTADPSAGTLTQLTYLSIGDAGNSGYGLGGHDGFSVPAVSDLPIFVDGAATSTNSVAWHPGDTSPDFTVLRWTAGTGEAGSIELAGTFSRNGEPNGVVDFYVFVNAVQVYSQTGVGNNVSFNFDLNSVISPGQSVDFVLGNGGNGYGGDESLISGSVSAIPEPSTYAALAGIGALGLVALRRRRA